jgi:hypothetical protein
MDALPLLFTVVTSLLVIAVGAETWRAVRTRSRRKDDNVRR